MELNEVIAGKYQVAHQLGAGTGGLVYKAVQLSTGQVVAVKVLALDNGTDDVRARRLERFRREISFCSQLYHPDIVRLLDSGELASGRHFAVFEYIPGITLSALLAERGMLTVQRACNLARQLLAPLAYAHERGILHRDLKPSNVMVTEDGNSDRVKILDFGISIASATEHSGDRLTLSHEWVGTPAYVAPEQLRGEQPTARSDLYAWGLMFLECLTGSLAVKGQSLPEIIRQHLLPEPHALPPALTNHRLGGLLSRVLEKNPDRRFTDANSLRATLEKIGVADLEDAGGYLRDSLSSSRESRRASTSDTLTDGARMSPVELRHATAVCIRVIPSGELDSAHTDEVDMLVEDSHALVHDVMTQFGADVSQRFGDGSLAYFGLSRSRDADARLAMRGALEVCSRLDQLPPWRSANGLSARILVGIHNGPVTLQLIDGSRRHINGLTAAIALRLAARAEVEHGLEGHRQGEGGGARPTILATRDFCTLVSRYADLRPLSNGDSGVPWSADPIMVSQLVGELPADANLLTRGRTPLIGRERELGALRAAWEQASGTDASAVLIIGEAGIGKSRLARELQADLGQTAARWLETRCLPEWQHGFLRPFARLLVQQLGIGPGGDLQAAVLLEARVKELGLDAAVVMPLLCAWLALPLPASHEPLASSPQKQRQLLLETVADVLVKIMAGPGAILIEDLHWADPSTLEQLEVLAQRARDRRVLVLMTARTRPETSWSIAPTEIVLSGLADNAVEQLVGIFLPDVAEGDQALREIVRRSDGLPLYVEELATAFSRDGTRATMTDAFHERVRAVPTVPAVPSSLRDLLRSRLDDVGAARGVAQFAAALGREFSVEMLLALHGAEEFVLAADLEQLISAQILIRRENAGGEVHLFRHALIRDAAYDSMSAEARKEVHETIARGLELRFPKVAEEQPDVLGHHWDHAGDGRRAISCLQRAAHRSGLSSAHLEAIAQLDRALALATGLPSDEQTSQLVAQLLLQRGAAIIAKRGFSDLEAGRSFERVAEIAPLAGDRPQLAFAARWGLWYFHNSRAELRRAYELAGELGILADTGTDPTFRVGACEALCEAAFCTGRLEEAVRASRRCEAEYDFERHRALTAIRGDDPLVASLSFEALAETILGHPDLAARRLTEGLAHAERLGYWTLRAGMHGQAAWVHLVLGTSGAREPDVTEARRHAQRAVELGLEHGFPFWVVFGVMLDACARVALGECGALAELRAGAEQWKMAGAALGRCWHLSFMAEGLQGSGRYDEAMALLEEGLAFCETSESRYYESEILRRRAMLLLDPLNPYRDVRRGLAACSAAREHAARYGADWWVLASTLALARATDGAVPAVRSELRAVVDRVAKHSTQVDPPVLREARAFLALKVKDGGSRDRPSP